jgi:hypothetical protein
MPGGARILWLMGDGLTVLSSVRKGSIWRVRIAWPSGTVHHFGKFTSEKDASDWIAARPWLTDRPTIPERPANSVPPTFRPKYRRGRRLDRAPAIST